MRRLRPSFPFRPFDAVLAAALLATAGLAVLPAQGQPMRYPSDADRQLLASLDDETLTIGNVSVTLNGRVQDIGDVRVRIIAFPDRTSMQAYFVLDPKWAWVDSCVEFHWLQIIVDDAAPALYHGRPTQFPVVDPPADGWDYMYRDAGRTQPRNEVPNFGWFLDAQPWAFNSAGEAVNSIEGTGYAFADAPTNPPGGAAVEFHTILVGTQPGSTTAELIAGFDWRASSDFIRRSQPMDLGLPNPNEAGRVSQALGSGRITGWTVRDRCRITCAQGGHGIAPPRPVSTASPVPQLNPPVVPAREVRTFWLGHLGVDRPGLFTTAMSVDGLAAQLGGVGGRDLLTGKFDPAAGTFVPDARAAALNTVGDEIGLQLHQNGLYAVFERPGTGVFLARRNGPNDPFFLMGQVAGLPESAWYDPALADVFGEMHLLFTSTYAQEIVLAPLELNTRSVLEGRPIVRAARPGSIPNAGRPIVSSAGDLLGVSHFDKVGLDNDHYLSLDLDPQTPPVLVVDSPGWQSSGGFAAGRFFAVEQVGLTANRVIAYDAPWWAGGQGHAGDALDLVVLAPPALEPRHAAVLGFAGRFLPEPLQLPGLGMLGVDPLGSVWLGIGLIDGRSGEGHLEVQLPDDPDLLHQLVPGQCATLDTFANRLVLSNTAGVRIL